MRPCPQPSTQRSRGHRPSTHPAATPPPRPRAQVALPKLDLSKFTDSYFKKAEAKKEKKKGEDEFFKVGGQAAGAPGSHNGRSARGQPRRPGRGGHPAGLLCAAACARIRCVGCATRPPLAAVATIGPSPSPPLAPTPRQTEAAKAPLAAEYIANQKALDAALLPALSADLKGYLSTRFTLRDGDRPHMMKF